MSGTTVVASGLRTLTFVAFLVLAASTLILGFRAEDWLNLEVGARALATPSRVWISLNEVTLYRPLTDYVHGIMHRLFALDPGPHLGLLVALFALQTLLLTRIARLRGASAAVAWTIAAAVCAQVHAYSGVVLWVSTTARCLATTFMLVALWVHHRAVASPATSLPSRVLRLLAIGLVASLATLSKEDALLLPALLIAVEIPRFRSLSLAARIEAVSSIVVAGLMCSIYLGTRVPPVPQPVGGPYDLRVGVTSLVQLAKFAALLGLPLVATGVIARLLERPSGTVTSASLGDRAEAWLGVVTGVAWATTAVIPYLLLGSFSFGYLFIPLWGCALILGHGLEWLGHRARLHGRRAPSPALVLSVLWLITASATGATMAASQFHHYREFAREAFATLDRTVPEPRQGASFVFLDPDPPEVPAGRSLFNMAFDNVPVSMARLHYRRLDLTGRFERGAAARRALVALPDADAVFWARQGHLIPLRPAPTLGRADRTTP